MNDSPTNSQGHNSGSRIASPRTIMIAAVAVMTLAMLIAPRQARANGVPIRIPLAYLTGLSNTGAPDARGEAELSFAEATIKLDVRGLSPLRNETYTVWLAKSSINTSVSVGSFNTAADGTGGYTGRLSGLNSYDYDLLIITIEPSADADPAPTARRSIGGFFTPLKKQDDSAAGSASDVQPAALPNTGDQLPEPAISSRRAVAGALFLVGGLSLYASVRRRRA